MSDMSSLYHEVIIDHGKNPRNFGKIEDALELKGLNPLCGDQLTLYVKIDNDRIADVKFNGQGCAISMASSSLMTQAIKGKTLAEAKVLFTAFHDLVMQEQSPEAVEAILGKLMILQGVKVYPSRIKCATLAWHALNAILEGKHGVVSTEKNGD